MPNSVETPETPTEEVPALLPTAVNVRLIEIGWMIAGRMDREDLQAIFDARIKALEYLKELFPQFDWRMPVVQRKELVRTTRVEPVDLLEAGSIELEAKHWDFVLVITSADLESHFKSYTIATPARAMSAAVLSTSRLDPLATFSTATEEERIHTMTQRIFALFMHLLGHLNGLDHHEDPHDFMYNIETIQDLDRMDHYDEEEIEILEEELSEVADIRLEEEARVARKPPLIFYIQAIWRNFDDIWNSVLQVEPWTFPIKLTRLTTAAISTLLIITITAEVWDLGMSLPAHTVLILSLLSLFITTYFIVQRQHLLTRRHVIRRLTEQMVITNASIFITILLGMFTVYLMLFFGTLFLGFTLFKPQIIAEWAPLQHGNITVRDYVVFAGFVASIGILLGALGASFEESTYFKHIAFIDEET